jgi:Fibronectin type III domain
MGEEDRKEAAMAQKRRRPPATSRPRATATRQPAARTRVRRRRRPTRWLTPLLALTAGGLVAGAQLTPVLVDLTANSTVVDQGATAGTTSSGSPGGGLLSWSTGSVAGDSNGATVTDGDAVTGLVVPQPPRPNGITLSPWAAHGESPTLTPLEPACGGYSSPKRITAGVVPGAGSATLTWQSDDREEVQGFRVQAVSQQLVAGAQPDPVVQTVTRPDGCVPVSVTITGLTPGDPYVFWLEEQVTSPSTGVTRLEQVGTTDVVVIG